MSINLSTAGMKVAYGVETSAGTKPSTFTNIPDPKSIPDLNPEPSTYDSTSLNATEFKTYIKGLKDTGGALGIKFAMSADFKDTWNALCTAASTAAAADKATWFEFYHPSLSDGFFFTGDPTALGFSGAEVDQAWDATTYVTPTGNIGWATKVEPTNASAD